MRSMPRSLVASLLLASPAGLALGADTPSPAPSTAKPVAATRSELKVQLENSKHSQPRLPLPPPTEEEVAKAKAQSALRRGAMGGIINNGRMRKLYLPAEFTSGGFQRDPDPAQSLSQAFKTEFFWIVSRANNCIYCQGHQEVKLLADGVAEDTIAALDGDWSEFTPAERAAFAFTLKLTNEPNALTDADVNRLRAFYNDNQILEIITAVAGFNAMNRWTGPLAIPQEEHRVYLTPTAEKYRDLRSRVAPLDPSAKSPACARPADRGPLETRAQVEAALDTARKRTSRLPLVAESKARALLPADFPSEPLPEWVRLLANFPKAGPPRVIMHRATEQKGQLPARLRAEIAWAAAREDRAWYALGHARERLHELGMTDDAIAALDAPGDSLPLPERQALALARKITVNPALVTDEDVATLRKSFTDHQVAEIVFQATEAAYFDRVTEAAGLRLER
jgi:alkylhydroperoxidase family enzyme